MRPEHAPRRSASAITGEFDGEAVIYHRETGEVHRLDSVGAVVWRYLDGQASVDELVTDLSSAFAVEPGTIRSDVNDLLERLSEAFLLTDGSHHVQPTGPRLLTNPPSP